MAEKKDLKEVKNKESIDKLVELLAAKELRSLDKEADDAKKKLEREKTTVQHMKESKARVAKQLLNDTFVPYRLNPEGKKILRWCELRDEKGKMQKYPSYGMPVERDIDGYYIAIPRGVSLMLPKTVTDILDKAEEGYRVMELYLETSKFDGAKEK